MAEHWYKNALLYCLDVKSFADGNGDGVGDFIGLTGKVEYLAGLNVDCVWLQPFYPSPMRDNGYDICDYYAVDPQFGTLGDFVEFTRHARERGIRVMIDLVVNHTSIDHPWFQAARRDPDSPYRDYYVWSQDKPADAAEGTVFPGEQYTTWTWDREAKAYYFHRFFEHQPELNIANPAVRREIEKITGFWLQLGVTGFRIDALPFLIELKGLPQDGHADPHAYVKELRNHVQTLCGEACLMAEANLPPEDVPEYFGDGDKIHMSFNFWVNQHMFLALAREDATPIREAYAQLPPLPAPCQWNNFLRTHDELDLARLADAERQEVFRAFGPEPRMQLYDRGIRRRLAPMLDNDRRRLELVHSLMLTLPGTPVLRYGDELGMGDDLHLPARESVRTPMQWTDGPNAGFSQAPSGRIALPVVAAGDYAYTKVNVEKQRHDPDSLLNWLERVIRRRKECREFGIGEAAFIDLGKAAVLAHCCRHDSVTAYALHNLGRRRVRVLLPIDPAGGMLQDVLSNWQWEAQPTDDNLCRIELEPYGYRWLRQEPR